MGLRLANEMIDSMPQRGSRGAQRRSRGQKGEHQSRAGTRGTEQSTNRARATVPEGKNGIAVGDQRAQGWLGAKGLTRSACG